MKYVIAKSFDYRKYYKYWNVDKQEFEYSEPSLFSDSTICLRHLLGLLENGKIKYEDVESISIKEVDL